MFDFSPMSLPVCDLMRRCVERGIRRFAIGQASLPLVRQLLPRLFPHRLEWFRLDDLDATPRFLVEPEERLVVLHVNGIHPRGIRLACGSEVFHLLDGQSTYSDVPRDVVVADIVASAEMWLQRLGSN